MGLTREKEFLFITFLAGKKGRNADSEILMRKLNRRGRSHKSYFDLPKTIRLSAATQRLRFSRHLRLTLFAKWGIMERPLAVWFYWIASLRSQCLSKERRHRDLAVRQPLTFNFQFSTFN